MYTYGYIYTLRKCLQAIYGSIVVGLQMIFKIFSLLIFLYLTPNLYQHIYSYPIVSWPLLKSPQTLEMGPTQQGLGKGTGLGLFQCTDVKWKEALYQTQGNPTSVKSANMYEDP